jgi:hypothetical protein
MSGLFSSPTSAKISDDGRLQWIGKPCPLACSHCHTMSETFKVPDLTESGPPGARHVARHLIVQQKEACIYSRMLEVCTAATLFVIHFS